MEEEHKSHDEHEQNKKGEHEDKHHEKEHKQGKIEHHTHKKEGIKIKKNDLWKSATTILAILLLISLYFNAKGGSDTSGTEITISKEKIADKAIDYINTNLLQAGTTAKLLTISEENNLYNLKMEIGGREFGSYVTKDGKLLFPSSIDMSEEVEKPETTTQPTPEFEKSDKPAVELFVMSHCPFGTQAEKGMIPVVELLGNKIDFDLKYVNYAMHGEKEVREQLRQYCIKTEQEDKFLNYLKCFLKDGDSETCISESVIDKEKLEACEKAKDEEYKITETLEDKSTWSGGTFPPFLIYDEDNKKYGVRGSPTLVINGKTASSGRSPSAYLAAICPAFNEAPEECDEELSSATPSSGFGYETGSATSASCS